MKKLILIALILLKLPLHAFDLGGDLGGILDVLQSQLTELKHVVSVIGNPKQITDLVGSASVINGLTKPPLQISNLWENASGAKAMAQTQNGLFPEIKPTFRLWDGSVVKRDADAYRAIDAQNQATKVYLEAATKNGERIKTLRLQHDLTFKAMLAAPTITEVVKLSAVASAQQSQIQQLLLEELAAAQKPLLQAAINQVSSQAQETALQEERSAKYNSLPTFLAKRLIEIPQTK